MKAYWELTKPRITYMVTAMAALGYFLGGGGWDATLLWVMLGTSLSSASSGVLNQYVERETDALMKRTMRRPLPTKRVTPQRALLFGLLCAAAGLGVLGLQVNALACGLSAFTIGSYVLVYTPLKQITPQSTWVGSLSGAVPPLIGWAAAQGTLGLMAWLLFSIQFIWQIPHFLALFWIYRDDYSRAGHRVMPVVDPSGAATSLQIALHSFALLLASLLPTMAGFSSLTYGYLTLLLGTAFLAVGLRASWTMELVDVRRLFRATLLYLPAVFLLLVSV